MQNHSISKPADLNELLRKVIFSRIVTGILGLAVFAGAWFGIAGRVAWWQGWAFLFTFISFREYLGVASIKVEPRTGARAQSSS